MTLWQLGNGITFVELLITFSEVEVETAVNGPRSGAGQLVKYGCPGHGHRSYSASGSRLTKWTT